MDDFKIIKRVKITVTIDSTEKEINAYITHLSAALNASELKGLGETLRRYGEKILNEQNENEQENWN